jgi:selenocysteine lyase/cysteine desulfurase
LKRTLSPAPEAPCIELGDLRQQVVGVGQPVPLWDGSTRPYVNFDNAASTPAFRHVRDKVVEFLDWYSSVHRGSGYKSLVSTRAYERAHEIVAEFVGADPETHSVIFGKNTTEAINVLASAIELSDGDVVITTASEHHSNDLPWRPRATVAYILPDRDGRISPAGLADLLERYEGRVKLVAVTGASNVTGFLPPIYEMAELAHEHGARILVDCAQLAPHRPIHMGSPGSPDCLDFVAISGHKMYAPFGTGALIGATDFFRGGAPAQRGGGTIEIVTLDEVHWAAPPERYEAGSPNVVGAVALAASIHVLSEVGMDRIAAHEKELTSYALDRMRDLDGVALYGSDDPDGVEDRLGVLPFTVHGMPHGKVAAILSMEGGIGVRNGCFCAHPYVLRLLDVSGGEYESYKQLVLEGDRSTLPGLVRVSFGCYNTAEEVDWLVEMLQRVVEGRYEGDYVVDRSTGSYFPRGFDALAMERRFVL